MEAQPAHVKKLVTSTGAMSSIASYMTIGEILNLNNVSQKFYNDTVPKIFETGHLYPAANNDFILYINSGALWGLKVGSQT